MRRLIASLAVFVGVSALGLAPVSHLRADGNHDPTFATVDFPEAIFTEVNGINACHEMVGRYESADGISHGYLLRKGTFHTIDVPSADFTGAIGINERREIVGRY